MDKDEEKGVSPSSSPSALPQYDGEGEMESMKTGTAMSRFRDSFKRNPNARMVTQATDAMGRPLKDQPPAEPALAMKLKNRHMQMIAIGGAIGTGLFVGSGSALANGGPASLIIAFGLVGIMVFCTVHALGELAVTFPVAGSFAVYASRFIDPAWGFAMSWNYALSWLVTLPLEFIAAAITLQFWDGAENTNPAAFVTLFLFVIVCINLFGVKGYGEAEFVFSLIKVIAILGFIILGIIIDCSGAPDKHYRGAHTWYNPGAFNNGFKGLCSVFVTAAFSFSGTEMVGLCAAETQNPRKTLPSAVKQVFWRICLFYMFSLTIVGVVVPYDNDELLNGTGSSDANASPFVIAVRSAGIQAVPSIMNVVILISVLSVGNTSEDFGYIDRSGRPLFAICFASCWGLLCYIVAAGSNAETQAFNWMIAISGLAAIFNWTSICICHIRFRAAWKLAGHTLDELAYRSQAGVIGSWLGVIFNILVLIAQFWTGFAPVGYASMNAGARTKNFFQGYLAFPIVLLCLILFKLIKKTRFVRINEVDLTSGRRDIDLQAVLDEERIEREQWPRWKKIYKWFC